MSVRAELVLAAALMVSVAVLVSLPPPGLRARRAQPGRGATSRAE